MRKRALWPFVLVLGLMAGDVAGQITTFKVGDLSGPLSDPESRNYSLMSWLDVSLQAWI